VAPVQKTPVPAEKVNQPVPDLEPVQLPDSVKKEKSRDPDAAKEIYRLSGHRSWVLATAFSPDRNLLVSGGVDGTAHVWGFSSSVPKERVVNQPNGSEIHTVAFAPDNQHFVTASGGLDASVVLWQAGPAEVGLRKRFTGYMAPAEVVIFTPDSRSVI